jgi:hypothetical protein
MWGFFPGFNTTLGVNPATGIAKLIAIPILWAVYISFASTVIVGAWDLLIYLASLNWKSTNFQFPFLTSIIFVISFLLLVTFTLILDLFKKSDKDE